MSAYRFSGANSSRRLYVCPTRSFPRPLVIESLFWAQRIQMIRCSERDHEQGSKDQAWIRIPIAPALRRDIGTRSRFRPIVEQGRRPDACGAHLDGGRVLREPSAGPPLPCKDIRRRHRLLLRREERLPETADKGRQARRRPDAYDWDEAEEGPRSESPTAKAGLHFRG